MRILLLRLPALLILTCAGTVSVPAADFNTLQPAVSIQLKDMLPEALRSGLRVHAVAAKPLGLHFVVAQGPRTNNPVVLITDEEGVFKKLVQVPPGEYTAFDVDDSGNLFFVSDHGTTQSVVKLAPDGTPIASANGPGEWLHAICVAGDKAIAVSATGMLYAYPSGLGKVAPTAVKLQAGSFAGPIRAAALSPRSLIIIDQVAGHAYLADSVDGSCRVFTPESSVVPKSDMTSADGRIRGTVLFPALTASGEGLFYIGVGRYKLAEGFPVLKLDTTGKTLATYRMLIPAFPQLVTAQNQGGFAALSMIGLTRTRLYGVDSRGIVIGYNLP